MKITIEVEKVPECCAVCDFLKIIHWKEEGDNQCTKCLATGIEVNIFMGNELIALEDMN